MTSKAKARQHCARSAYNWLRGGEQVLGDIDGEKWFLLVVCYDYCKTKLLYVVVLLLQIECVPVAIVFFSKSW